MQLQALGHQNGADHTAIEHTFALAHGTSGDVLSLVVIIKMDG